MELKDKVVIVTGAAQGLGRQFALDCAANGMKVALADIDSDEMEKTRTECKSKGVANMVDKNYIVQPNEIIEIRFNV